MIISKWHIRYVKIVDEQPCIKLGGKLWKPKRGDAKSLVGIAMAFGTYWHTPDLLNLWGTASMYYHNDLGDDVGKVLWEENGDLMSGMDLNFWEPVE